MKVTRPIFTMKVPKTPKKEKGNFTFKAAGHRDNILFFAVLSLDIIDNNVVFWIAAHSI